MPWKFNPFTSTFDQTGSSGGASYIDGEVATFAALPTSSTTAPLDSAWLVRTATGTWFTGGSKPAGIYIRTATIGTLATDWTYAGTMPDVFSDANFTLYDNADSSKTLKFQLSDITTGTPRTLTVPNASGTLVLSDDARIANIGSGAINTTTGVFTVDDELLALRSLSTGTHGSIQARDFIIYDGDTQKQCTLYAPDLTEDRLLTFPNATGTVALTSDLRAKTDVFTSNGTWTKPTGAKRIEYLIISGGGGGGGGRRSDSATAASGGAGGNGGGFIIGRSDPSFFGSTVSVTVGAGGTGGAARTASDTSGAAGSNGGDSSFGATLVASGSASAGAGGGLTAAGYTTALSNALLYGASLANSTRGGSTSITSASLDGLATTIVSPSAGGGGGSKNAGTTYYLGGNGGTVGDATSSRTGKTLGGVAAVNSAGGAGGVSHCAFFGTGGAGGTANSSGAANKGGAGGNYGAGGGGGSGALNGAGGDNSGGAGAGGIVVVTTYF